MIKNVGRKFDRWFQKTDLKPKTLEENKNSLLTLKPSNRNTQKKYKTNESTFLINNQVPKYQKNTFTISLTEATK